MTLRVNSRTPLYLVPSTPSRNPVGSHGWDQYGDVTENTELFLCWIENKALLYDELLRTDASQMQRRLQQMSSHRTRPAGLVDVPQVYNLSDHPEESNTKLPGEEDEGGAASDSEPEDGPTQIIDEENLLPFPTGHDHENDNDRNTIAQTAQTPRLPPSLVRDMMSTSRAPLSVRSTSSSSDQSSIQPRKPTRTETSIPASMPTPPPPPLPPKTPAPPSASQSPPPPLPTTQRAHADGPDLDRQALLKQLDVLRMKFKENVIPANIEQEETHVVRLVVERNLLQLKRARNTAMYKLGMAAFLVVMEFILARLTRLDLSGFIGWHAANLDSYEELLVEMGDVNTPFSASPPYIQLIVLLFFNTAIFLGAALVQKAFSVDILPMIGSMTGAKTQGLARSKAQPQTSTSTSASTSSTTAPAATNAFAAFAQNCSKGA